MSLPAAYTQRVKRNAQARFAEHYLDSTTLTPAQLEAFRSVTEDPAWRATVDAAAAWGDPRAYKQVVASYGEEVMRAIERAGRTGDE